LKSEAAQGIRDVDPFDAHFVRPQGFGIVSSAHIANDHNIWLLAVVSHSIEVCWIEPIKKADTPIFEGGSHRRVERYIATGNIVPEFLQ
jgi:hypothetical protein